jgi:ABC-type polysaccharide/polyol phosphate transport system ATPase subunit
VARIEFNAVDLIYPVRENRGITLKDLILTHVLRRPGLRRVRSVHALKQMSFRIRDGERVGIIGANGAGKSTLLRAIGGVYPVHHGTRQVDGEICSLFDIGLGLEYAATGWENIRFRGYLQGETPRTIRAKMQAIADFAELGEFLHLSLNCYSTGMIMRLAFAIATAGNPEVLLLDEVFFTGDLRFQERAKERMRDFMGRAGTVVMVSHNLDFLESFCTRVFWLEQGQLRADGPPRAIIHAYRTATTGGNGATPAADRRRDCVVAA